MNGLELTNHGNVGALCSVIALVLVTQAYCRCEAPLAKDRT